jgi:NADH-quinone oxidoreductase subunit F
MGNARMHCLVCAGAGCVASGSLEVSAALRKSISAHGLDGEAQVIETGCLGPCAAGPVAVIYPDGVFYNNVKPADADAIVGEHLLKGRVVERLVHRAPDSGQAIPGLGEIAFFNRQKRIILANCGVIDPLNIEEYMARDGYQALSKVLAGMTPEQVIDAVTKSGLRGRGGAGFPTGVKWRFTRQSSGDPKYVVMNGDEGDPGAFMDRSLLEGDPHAMIEGMAIAGFAIGARQGFAYIRAEYPLAVERFQKAIETAREYGLLGQGIMGSAFDFDMEIRMGSGAFVCGEETALMTSIEGNRGEPRPRPPFPAQKGLWDKPSLLNNVETYANVPVIIRNGPEWYASVGSEKSKGTKVFALAGAVNNTGLVEVPIGTPLGEIVFDLGGGIPNGKKFKAAQIGGPSGGCIPREHLNVAVDYESLTQLGAIMGSGGLIVMDEDTCMVDMARFFLDFTQDESCGKCPPCRVGTKRMLEIVTRICEGKGEDADIERLERLGRVIQDASLCGLGQTAPNPVLSTIRHFRHEYIAHIRDKKCPAGVCPALVRAPCQNACPAGVDVPGFVSLVGEQRHAEALKLHRERNPFASVCARVCFHTCEDKCRRADIDDAVAIRGVKRFMVETETSVQMPEIRENAQNAGRRIAIVGAWPAGLTCAYFLARLGYRPTVLEAEARAGGMLLQAIPAYRLPRAALEREIRMIERLGVEIRTGVRLGRDVSLEGLRDQGFEAVFLAVGAPQGARLGVPGEDLDGVVDALCFLREYNLRGAAGVGAEVAVIGGGNAAVDAARSAVRLGARNVSILYRRTRGEMPAYAEEIEEAEREGIHLWVLTAPVEIIARDGRAAGVRCQTMRLGEFDRSGRRKPGPSGEDPFTVPADTVIAAVGQSLDAAALLGAADVRLDKAGRIITDPSTGRTSLPWLFAGGDTVTGPASVVDAVAAGERAAAGIDRLLTGADHAFWRACKTVDTHFDPDADPAGFPRARMTMTPVAQRAGNFDEVERAWTEEMACKEAKRCLRCDFKV